MRVILVGGYGFIGSHIGRALLQRGDEVIALGRSLAAGRRILPGATWHAIDLNAPVDGPRLDRLFAGADSIVNASGALQSSGSESLARVQDQAVRALADAAIAAGVKRFVQISAAGAEALAPSEFMRTKAAADEYIARAGIDHAILRPGLVIARDSYGGTALVRMAAALPYFRVETGIESSIQCVAMDDLVESVLSVLDSPGRLKVSMDLVSRDKLKLDTIIALHRRWLQMPETRAAAYVGWLVPVATRVADALGHLGWRSPLRSTAIVTLEDGISGDPAAIETLLGRPATELRALVDGRPLGRSERMAAQVALLLPFALGSLMLLWIGSGVLGLVRLDAVAARLAANGTEPSLARMLAAGSALADIIVGLMLCWRLLARPAILVMAAMALAYLVVGTIIEPGLWLDPLAPLLKLVPILALLGLCWVALDER